MNNKAAYVYCELNEHYPNKLEGEAVLFITKNVLKRALTGILEKMAAGWNYVYC